MPDPNPWKARQAAARKRLAKLTAGDIQEARKLLWAVLIDGSDRLRSLPPDAHNDFYKLANAVTGAVREYRALVESSEMEQRVTALEERERAQWRARA